jgi:hypothetical protein
MQNFTITARFHSDPPPQNWRAHLAQRLGARPRRLGLWAELALYGALGCLDVAAEKTLPATANILVASRYGPIEPVRATWQQMQDGLPMPLSFLQTQPSQMLAALATSLNWHGDACFTHACNPADVMRLAAARGGAAGTLLGWVDEAGQGSTVWLRLNRRGT